MDFTKLGYFVEVVQCRSINKASKKLFVTPPAISTAIKSLEEEIGIPLLIRSSGGMSPTPAGQNLFEDALRILDFEEKWKNYKANQQRYSKKLIEVVTTSSVSQTVLNQLIRYCAKKFPQIIIAPTEVNNFEFLKKFGFNNAKIGINSIANMQIDSFTAELQLYGYTFEKLLEDEYVIFTNKNSGLAKNQVVAKSMMKNYTMVTMIRHEALLRETVYMQFTKSFYENCIFASNLYNLFGLLASGTEYFAFMPSYMVQFFSPEIRDTIIIRDLDDLELTLSHFLVLRSEQTFSHEERQLCNIIKLFYQRGFFWGGE